jgi:hypothetical protein
MNDSPARAAQQDLDVECTHCGIPMTSQLGSSQQVRYFHCSSCHRWTTDSYTEVFRADTKMRARLPGSPVGSAFHEVKSRIASWLGGLDASDPYRLLGVKPSDTIDAIRERYKILARENHPDRGGSQERMQHINAAYEQILKDRRPAHEVRIGAPALAHVLPGR